MRMAFKAQVRPAPNSFRRNPFMCALVTAAVATTFWMGMIWVAQQIRL
jgi:hypothetical protein